jgi:hypothetical protein
MMRKIVKERDLMRIVRKKRRKVARRKRMT